VVDFNNETTIGTPAANIVKILLLQRRSDLIEAWELYKKKHYQNVDADISLVRARLFSWFLEFQAALQRRLSDKDYEALCGQIKSNEPEEIEAAIYALNEQMDVIRLTRIDTKTAYDKTNVEIENREKGL